MFDLRTIVGQIGPGLIRTVTPLVVAYLSNIGLVRGLGMDESQLTLAVSSVIGALYWLIARLLEVYVAPRWGALLGSARTPVYGRTSDDGLAVDITSLPRP